MTEIESVNTVIGLEVCAAANGTRFSPCTHVCYAPIYLSADQSQLHYSCFFCFFAQIKTQPYLTNRFPTLDYCFNPPVWAIPCNVVAAFGM